MKEITDDFMSQMMATTKPYTVIILKKGPQYEKEDARKIAWEHGRRNFSLREEGSLVVVCPVNDGSDVTGIGIFNETVERTKEIMDTDPGVVQNIFTYEIHNTRSFPGDKLP